MSDLEQSREQQEMAASGSSQPQFMISSTGNRNPSNVPLIENEEYDQILVPDKKSWRNLFAYMGPGFLVCIAYIDPGNFATDLQAGSQYKYGLLWIILVASSAALIIQSLAANLGVVTGKHLAEHCRAEYSKVPNFILWILAESAIVACDIPEVMPPMRNQYDVQGFVICDWNSLCSKYALQNSSMVWCSSDRVEYIDSTGIAAIRGNGATGLAISLLGAMVMPHNLFLHSALVLSRKVPRSVNGIKDACRFYFIESSFALMVAFLINLSVISVSGSVCNSTNLNPDDEKNCQDLDLNKASFLLKACDLPFPRTQCPFKCVRQLELKAFCNCFACIWPKFYNNGDICWAICDAGTQLSDLTRFNFQGFLNLRLKPWIRNFLTRCLAIVPSLIVAIIGGSDGAGKLIIIASMILSFELPFALIPLLKFTSSTTKMGTHANSIAISATTWFIGSLIMGINIYYLATSFVKVLLHSHIKVVGKVFCGILGFSGMLVYLAAIAYLVFRRNKEATHILALTSTESRGMGNELGGCLPREDIISMQLPQRATVDVE
ncbi:hypothetical protein RHGRI_024752 [Rhododendron griersonianum]|uniref:Uncharacterized protein n=1 Tax=Rhododendron griersonianum TaxID=479676 RepID=A0AAV6JAP6_9ERIC|nr:hypothetical protein RHGRI_024752 [Rhododendron griersonianum]